MYFIVRINFKGQTEAHSIETRSTKREALARFYNIIAADVGNSQVTYSAVYLLNEKGHSAVAPFVYLDDNEIEFPFNVAIIRTFNKNSSWSNSVEYRENLNEAHKRFFNILAADLQDEQIAFNLTAIISAEGSVEEIRAFENT